jgi:hypothetical protein
MKIFKKNYTIASCILFYLKNLEMSLSESELRWSSTFFVSLSLRLHICHERIISLLIQRLNNNLKEKAVMINDLS